MTALHAKRHKPKWGTSCDLCRAENRQVRKPSNFHFTVLGRPLLSACTKCAKDVEKMWSEAL